MGRTLEEDNVATIMEYYACLQASDGAGMEKFLASKLDYWVYSTSPYAGHYDREAFLAVLPSFFAKQAAPIQFTFENITAQGDRVCVFARGRMPLKAGGRYDNVYHYLFRLKDSKIFEVKEVYAPDKDA